MLLHSYYDFNYILKQPIKIITKLLIKAKNKENENFAKSMYIALYPKMNEETFISFDEFYNKGNTTTSVQTEEEILTDVKDIINTFNEGVK